MLRWFYLQPDLLNLSVRANQKSDAMCAGIVDAHERSRTISAVRIDDFLVIIREQRERQIVFLDELRMRFCGISAHAQNTGAFLFKFGKSVAKWQGFFGAARRGIFWVIVRDVNIPAKMG